MSPFEKLKKLCSSKPAPPKLLIVCPDVVRRTRALDYALTTLQAGAPDIAIQKHDAASLSLDAIRDLRDSSMTLSLFSSQKFIVIKNIDKAPAALAKELEQILDRKDPSNIYICTASSASQRNSSIKNFDKELLIDFVKPEGEEIIKWTTQELKRQGCPDTEIKVARMIAAMASDDLDEIAALIEKLALYSEGSVIESKDLEALDSFKEKVQEFTFVNLLASGKKTASLSFIENLKENESSIFPLLGLLSKMFSNYLRLKIASNNSLPEGLVAKDLGLSPWALKKQAEIGRSCNEAKLARALKSIVRADSQIKNKNLGESAVLVELVSNAS